MNVHHVQLSVQKKEIILIYYYIIIDILLYIYTTERVYKLLLLQRVRDRDVTIYKIRAVDRIFLCEISRRQDPVNVKKSETQVKLVQSRKVKIIEKWWKVGKSTVVKGSSRRSLPKES